MPLIQVRDIPDHIYRLLAERAKRERRSLAQEAVVTLARGLQVEVDAKARRRRCWPRVNPVLPRTASGSAIPSN